VFRYFIFLLGLSFILLTAEAQESQKTEGDGPVIEYLEFKPKLTVNLAGTRQYLMLNVQLLAEGAEAVAAIQKHMPMLRHELIMLFSNRPADQLQTMQQREALRKETADVIKKTLKKLHSEHGFKDVYFTEFLID
jgi:flagellar FliL protein